MFQELPEFWPEKGSPVEVDAGNFKLSMRDELEEQPGYTTREFILESIQVKKKKKFLVYIEEEEKKPTQ